jgi:hypothetical protein
VTRSARAIRDRFGVESALDYLLGEKLVNFAKAAEQDPKAACPVRFVKRGRSLFVTFLSLAAVET